MAGNKKRYKGYVARKLLDKHTYQGEPSTSQQVYELTKVEASTLASRMPEIPLSFEHKEQQVDLGKVTEAWVEGDDLLAEFEFDEHASAELVSKLVDDFKLNCLSLTHVAGSLVPLELSLVEKGAREGSVLVDRPGIDRLVVKASSREIKAPVYKTIYTSDSVIQASDRKMSSIIDVRGQPNLTNHLTNPVDQQRLNSLLPPNNAHPFSSPAEEKAKQEAVDTKQQLDYLTYMVSQLTKGVLPTVQHPPQASLHQQLLAQQQQAQAQQAAEFQQLQLQQQQLAAQQHFLPKPVQASSATLPPQQAQQAYAPPAHQANPAQQHQANPDSMQVDSQEQQNPLLAAAQKIMNPTNRILNEADKTDILRNLGSFAEHKKQSELEMEKLRQALQLKEKEVEEKNKALEQKEKERKDLVATYTNMASTFVPGLDEETLKQIKEAAEAGNVDKFNTTLNQVKVAASAAQQQQQMQQQIAILQAQLQAKTLAEQQAIQQTAAQQEYEKIRALSQGGFNNFHVQASAANYQQPMDSYQMKLVQASRNMQSKQDTSRLVSSDESWKQLPFQSGSLVDKVLSDPLTGKDTNLDEWNAARVLNQAQRLNPNHFFQNHL